MVFLNHPHIPAVQLSALRPQSIQAPIYSKKVFYTMQRKSTVAIMPNTALAPMHMHVSPADTIYRQSIESDLHNLRNSLSPKNRDTTDLAHTAINVHASNTPNVSNVTTISSDPARPSPFSSLPGFTVFPKVSEPNGLRTSWSPQARSRSPNSNEYDPFGYFLSFDGADTTSGRTTPSSITSLSLYPVIPKGKEQGGQLPIFDLPTTPYKHGRFDTISLISGQTNAVTTPSALSIGDSLDPANQGSPSPSLFRQEALQTSMTSRYDLAADTSTRVDRICPNATPSSPDLTEWSTNETYYNPALHMQYPSTAGFQTGVGSTVLGNDLLDARGSGVPRSSPQSHFSALNAAFAWYSDHNGLNFDGPSVHRLDHAYNPALSQFQHYGNIIDNAEPVYPAHPPAHRRKGHKNFERDSLDVQPVFYCAVPGCGHPIRRHYNVLNHYRSVHKSDYLQNRCAVTKCRAGYICIAHPDPQPAKDANVSSLSNKQIHAAPKICSAAPTRRHPNYVCNICRAAFETPKMLADHKAKLHPGQ